jgi:two-component system, NtrC family, response regulator PilR
VRELENLLHRAVALSSGGLIDGVDLGLAEVPRTAVSVAAPVPMSVPVLLPGRADVPAGVPSDLVAHLDEVEREVLVRALEHHRYNRTAAGAAMGLTLRQMRYRMARLGIQVAGDTPAAEDADALGDLAP